MISGKAYPALLLAAVCGVLAAAPARAQTEAQKQQAKEHYERGRRLYEVGRYGEAIEEYQKAYVAVDDPNLLFNIAQAYRLWDKPEEAVRFYRNYLRRAPNAPNRATVEKQIAELERAIEDRKRATPPALTPPAPAPAPTPPPAPAPEPPPAAAPPPTAVEPPPPPLTGAPVAPPPAEPEVPAPSGRGRRIAAYSLLIGGGALVLTSLVTGAMAAQKAREVEKQGMNRQAFDPKLEQDGKALNGVAVVAGLVGVAAGVTGGVLLLTGRSTEVAVYPLAGPALAGAGARLTF